jgi:acyl-CoA synthetase (AMP-forming)/AMP-acid ligase II
MIFEMAATQKRADSLVAALCAAPLDAPFVTMWKSEDDFESLTYGEFLGRATQHAALMRACGAARRDRVVLVMSQGVALMSAFVGAMMIGAAPAILAYPNFKVEPAKYRSGLVGVTKNLGARLVMLDDSFPEEFMCHIEADDRTTIVRGTDACRPIPIDRFATDAIESGDVAFIQHSAGTTGLQKGVALSHGAVLRQLRNLAIALQINSQDCIYSWLPLYHDMGLIACFMLPIVYHLPIVMQAPEDWVMQPVTMLQLISKYRCSLAWLPNFSLQFLARRVRSEDRQDLDLSSLRMLVNCSEPVRAQSIDEFTAAYSSCGLLSTVIHSSYAMAENVFAVTQSEASARPARIWVDTERLRIEQHAFPTDSGAPGSICLVSSGRCLANNEIRIVSPDKRELPDGAVGEILIRSDSLFEGYYNRADLTSEAIKEGWYWSGDLGFVYDGEIYVIGRKKDLIIVAGKNIHPQDVEEIVSRHPELHDGRVVAIGLYNPDTGTEDIVAVAEAHDFSERVNTNAIERDVRSAVVAELGIALRKLFVKPPRWLVKSTAGKPARAATREKLLAEHPELNSSGLVDNDFGA